ncbi:DUF6233 domain-containing protein [Streptomyces sp. NPDC048384]|uniref:DUF6233 domain-containing protein n=1 Tax=Streptomyces sp. NPDC048384 TaxID=3155487 RepID=UPI003422E436
MFDDLPPDRLHTLRVWHALWVERIDHKIEAVQQRQAEAERGRRARPQPPDWIVELGIGADRTPVQVHAGDCHMTGKRRREVSRDEARRLLAAGLPGCSHRCGDFAVSGPRSNLAADHPAMAVERTDCART